MNEQWVKRERSLWNMIRLDGDASDHVTVSGLRSVSRGYEEWGPFVVVLVSVRTEWQDGEDEGKQRISLTLRRPEQSIHKSFMRGTEFLEEIPAWLYDLITRASPRDIETPEPLAYGGRRFGQ